MTQGVLLIEQLSCMVAPKTELPINC